MELASRSPVRRLNGETIFLLAGLSALGSLATNIILPAFPRIGESLNTTPQELALTLSSFFIAFAFGQLLVGPLSDRYGRKWLVIGGLVVFAVGSGVCAISASLPMLIVGRVVQALGACAASVLSRAIARDLFDGEALARALAMTMIAGAAAPGFSPLVGSAFESIFSWRMTFLVVGAFGIALALHYTAHIGETNPANRRTPLAINSIVSGYRILAADQRFLLPAASVSLVIGGLFSFFAAAPAILMSELGLSAIELGASFAGTVLIVFAAGFLAPRLAHRFGQRIVCVVGIIIAQAGSISMFVFASDPNYSNFTVAIGLYLLGLGLVNPLGTAIALHPFGSRAGLASALLGFMQMSCAAIGASAASILPFTPTASLAAILTAGSVLAFLMFLPVSLRQPKVAPAEPCPTASQK